MDAIEGWPVTKVATLSIVQYGTAYKEQVLEYLNYVFSYLRNP